MKRGAWHLGLAVLWASLAASPGWGGVAGIKPTLRPHGGPHGGTLVSIDGALALEVVYDCASGRVTVHVLDAQRAPLPIRQDILRLRVNYADVDGRPVDAPAARFPVDLEPSPTNSGETATRGASQFSADSPELRGVCQFVGTIERLQIKEASLRDIPFRYPGP